MKPGWKTALAFAHDLAACAAAWLAAFWLRFNLEIPEFYAGVALRSLAWVVPVHAALFLAFGLYRGVWRYASLPDLERILAAVGTGALAVPALLFMLRIPVPRSVLIMSPVFLLVLMGGSRLAYRAWKERMLAALVPERREPVLVVGSGDAAVNLIKEMARSREWRVVGALAEEPDLAGRELHGVKVLGPVAEAGRLSERLGVAHAIIAMPEASHEARRRAVEACAGAKLKVLTVPSYDDLVSGRVTVSQVRHVELDDLLGRDPVALDTEGLRGWLAGRVAMVTGAGGSIGAELCRQIARFEPRLIVLFELSEYALYCIEEELAARTPRVPTAPIAGDVRDRARVAEVLREFRPSVVFHAAAYKHVPLMENHNAWQAVLNNVGGTLALAREAIAAGVEKLVLVSTDKAVHPASVMGASKRLAEMVCQALQGEGATRFVTVRFGNVLGSTGSVVPKFRAQIAAGGPVTVTHPEVARYFMSIPEAAQLVLQAAYMGSGGEIFVLDMGRPVRIADLARDLIRLSGFSEAEIPIVYTGLRPGEKLYEEPLGPEENLLATPHPKLRIARARSVNGEWLAQLEAWLGGEPPLDEAAVKLGLARWVPEYRPELPAGGRGEGEPGASREGRPGAGPA
jgi:FlaA1/EpsC-like NDP-sugar epimerase